MEYRHLGKSGLKISEIAFGNWITHATDENESNAIACINEALDCGITTFDTADVYAQTWAETVMGKALSGQRREGIEIFTKTFWRTGPGPNDSGLSRKHIIESCNSSLRRLQTDYVDLYQAHRFDVQTPLEETLRAFEDIVRQGKALYIGVSEWSADQIRQALEMAEEMGFDRIISSQPQYSMLWRVIEAEVEPLCRENGIGQVVWSPIAQGVLTGKYLPGQPVPGDSRAVSAEGAGLIARFMEEKVLSAVQRLHPIAHDTGLSMAQLAVAWVLQNPGVSAAIIGASRPGQVTENVKASGVALDDEIMKRIDDALGDVVIRDPSLTTSPSHRP